MKTIAKKYLVSDLINAGYTGYVYASVSDDMDAYPVDAQLDIKANKQRTLTQNRAIHKYCSMLAKDLNDAGYDMKKVIKEEVDIPWSEGNAKEFLWRPIQKALGLPDSTTDLATNEVSQVYEVLSKNLAEKFNITTPFPSRHGN